MTALKLSRALWNFVFICVLTVISGCVSNQFTATNNPAELGKKNYNIYIFGNIQKNRTEAEIFVKSGKVEKFLGIAFENKKGWLVELENPEKIIPEAEFIKAKNMLSAYVNRKGLSNTEDLTNAGHSFLLMLKSDGTSMGEKYETE